MARSTPPDDPGSPDLTDPDAVRAWLAGALGGEHSGGELPGGDPVAGLLAGLLGGHPGPAPQGPFGPLSGPGAGDNFDPVRRRNPPIELPPPPLRPLLLTVKVSLDQARPPIWRRMQLRGDLTLDRVHDYLQPAMGWAESHLHRFEPGPAKNRWQGPYFLSEFDVDEGDSGTPEAGVRLDQVLTRIGDRLFYTYDFGDDWAHTITVEKVRAATVEDPPAFCLKAVRACPPEDVGGIHTWNELAEQLRRVGNPADLPEEFEMYANWLPPDVDPDEADADEVNLAMSFVGIDPERVLEMLAASAFQPPQLHPAYWAVLAKAPTKLAMELAALAAFAVENVEEEDGGDENGEEEDGAGGGESARAAEEDGLRSLLRPWHVLLDIAGPDGIALTKAGWMSPDACRRLWIEGGLDWGYGKGNREQHTSEIRLVREVAVRARLVRSYRGRLVRTKLGTAAAHDVNVLADAIAGTLLPGSTNIAGDDLDVDERVVTLLLVAADAGRDDSDQPAEEGAEAGSEGMLAFEREQAFLDEVARLLAGLGWSVDGRPLQQMDLSAVHRVLSVLTLAGRAVPGPRRPPGPAAREIARRALRHRE